jgi:hypothetical protein
MEHKEPGSKVFKFMVDGKPYDSPDQIVTGAQIKIIASIAPTFGLFLEGHGNTSDTNINDADQVDLSQPGREQFYTVPPATFGNRNECAHAPH